MGKNGKNGANYGESKERDNAVMVSSSFVGSKVMETEDRLYWIALGYAS